MRTIERSTQFKKDYKKYSKVIYKSELDARLREVLGHLLADEPLPIRFRDHQLRANWKGYRDCHVFPDLVLIYQLQGVEVVRLVRLGSHSDLSL
jgi:mRNA interferase YafQ